MSCGLFALIPNPITAANYTLSSIAEPDTTKTLLDGSPEAIWVTGTNYPINKRVIRTQTHRVYRDTIGGVSSVAPELEPIRWFDEGPTNKWAPFDSQASTQAVTDSPFTFTVQPGAYTNAEFFGLANVSEIYFEIDDPTDGIVHSETYGLEEFISDDPHWELYFEAPRFGDSLSVPDLPVYPGAVTRVEMRSPSGQVRVGLVAFGVYRYLGLAQYGFRVKYRDYGYTITDKWGTSIRVPGAKAKDLVGSALITPAEANGVSRALSALLDVGAVYVPSPDPQYRYLKTWGLIQPAEIEAAGPTHALVSIEVQGLI